MISNIYVNDIETLFKIALYIHLGGRFENVRLPNPMLIAFFK